MRNDICDKRVLESTINNNIEWLAKDIKKIDDINLELDDNSKYSDNKRVKLLKYKKRVCRTIRHLMLSMYSYGENIEKIEELFYQEIPYIKDVGFDGDYVKMIHYISLGILFEAPRDTIQIMVNKIDEEKTDDILLDYLIEAYGLTRNIHSTSYQKENPYREVMKIIKESNNDKKMGSEMLYDYTEKHWLKGHSDYGWTNWHKEIDMYYGVWSYEAGAIAKILSLDDSRLVNSNQYPYDLVHYKNSMKFKTRELKHDITGENYKNTDGYIVEIPYNMELEQIIPIQFHETVTQIIVDYETMEDLDFWNKYELDQIWFDINGFIEDKKKGNLGELIVFILARTDYICQLDWKEELEDYEEHIRNYWKDEDTKMIEFHLDNDQQYFAKIPRKNQICDVYEIKVSEVRSVASDE